ncbi:MAG: cadherin-like beta sandwich domain-containing protein [Fibrobacteres bacterium]|nr:cadherin-like beta sandwich domain-containing protein [Fibrobacterota bacterium]
MMRQKMRVMFFALTAVLLSCQSTRFEEEVVVDDRNFSIAISVPRAALRPDSVAWSTPGQKGRVPVLPASVVGGQLEISVHLDKPIGPDTLRLDVWKSALRIGTQAYVFQGSGLVKIRATRDTMACKILDTLEGLNAEFPLRYPLGKDSSLAKVMARLVVNGDPSFATWQEKFPAGIDTARMRREALVYAAASGQYLSSLAATWSLGMDATSAKAAILALVPKYIAAADTAKLFPRASLRLVVPVTLAADVYADSTAISIRGRYSAESRLMGPSVRVLKNGVEDRDHFVVEQRAQPGASASIWDLDSDGGVKVKALGSASPGMYTLEVVMEDGKMSDTSRVSFSVLARAKVDPVEPNPVVAHDTLLTQLIVSEGSLSPSFSPTKRGYADTLENSVRSVVIQGVPADSTDEVFVSIGASFMKADGTPILLAEGMVTTVTLRVKNVNGGTCDYVIGLYRKPRPVAHDTTLKSLVVSSGALFPGFSPTIFRYVDTVDNAVGSVTVVGVPADSTDTVFVSSGGAFVKADGTPTPLPEGVMTTVTLRVKNVNGRFQDYVIGIFRIIPQPSVADGWNPAVKYGTLKDDRDGQSYWTVKIGNQNWMAQNLNFAGAGECPAGGATGTVAVADSCKKYGRLYYWAEAMALSSTYITRAWSGGEVKHQGLCPTGWHVPLDAEWQALEVSVGMSEAVAAADGKRGATEGTKLMSTSGWLDNTGADVYGFRGLPVGFAYAEGSYLDVGSSAYFWSATEYGASAAWSRNLLSGEPGVNRREMYKSLAISVRCLEN